MSARLSGKTALVTGAGRGIGRAIAVALGTQGAKVVLAARNGGQLENTAIAVRQAGGEAEAVPVDLRDESAIKHLVAETHKRCGRLDILVNNEGVTFAGRLEETGTADWDRCMTVNSRGAFILCREAIGLLRASGRGYIVNICSVVGVKGYAHQIAYTASKHALRGMSIALARELKGEPIRVHTICPGGVDTDMVDSVRPDIAKDELIVADEIAELVVYLVTHRGNAVIDELRIRRATAEPWF